MSASSRERMLLHNCYALLPVFLVIIVHIGREKVHATTYTAGVVEFASDILQPQESAPELILRNAHRYVDIIATAAHHSVDIIVFPECGLTSIVIPTARVHIKPFLTKMPDIGANPCDLPEAPKVLKLLSCAARSHNIYVVFNLDEVAPCTKTQSDCPSDGSLFYNTNLALDRNGTIVSKYRKFNLFIEPEFNTTKTPDHSWFDTDFGVRFGMFICFDILFREPTAGLLTDHKISNFVYSTAWFSEIPLLTATPVQAAWAYANDVNLLASGYSNTPNKNAGSGIYAGRDGRLTASMPEHTSTKLLIASVSSDQRGVKPTPTEEISFSEDMNTSLNFFHDSLVNYTTIIVKGTHSHLEYENEGFMCNITTEQSLPENGPTYRLIAFGGLRSYVHVRTVNIEVCGVVACMDSTLSSCGYRPSFHTSDSSFSNISISAVSQKQLLSYPITMDKHFLPFPGKTFQYDSRITDNGYGMDLFSKNSQNNFITFALFRNG